MIGILMDQNAARREGVFVDFFGRPASTSRSLALLAVRTRTPVVPVFARRDRDGRHAVMIRPPLAPPESTGADAAGVELTARCPTAIERACREPPGQWLCSHDR